MSPFDGIPFVNSGSRAVVMECQYGPRRRGNFCKKRVEKEGMMKTDYKQTCPARQFNASQHHPQSGNSLPVVLVTPVHVPANSLLQVRESYDEFCLDTHLSDSSTQANTTLTPETASLLSRLHLSMFPANSLLQPPTDSSTQANTTLNPETASLLSWLHPSMFLLTASYRHPLSDSSTQANTTLTPETASLLSRLHLSMFPANSLLQPPTDTHLSDSSTQANTTLTPETASLLSRLHLSMFPANSLLQLQCQIDEMQGQKIKMETGTNAEGDLIGPAVGLEADSSVVNGIVRLCSH
ncbi:hypothetical protein ScPMuIL_012939 [Solemya velum]